MTSTAAAPSPTESTATTPTTPIAAELHALAGWLGEHGELPTTAVRLARLADQVAQLEARR